MNTIVDQKAHPMPIPQRLFRANSVSALLILPFAFTVNGCSSAKPPTAIVSEAEMGVRAASEARADELAPMDLQSAREKLDASKKSVAAEKYDEARRLAESAQVEAELAKAKAEAEAVRRTTDNLRHKLDPSRADKERSAAQSPTTATRE